MGVGTLDEQIVTVRSPRAFHKRTASGIVLVEFMAPWAARPCDAARAALEETIAKAPEVLLLLANVERPGIGRIAKAHHVYRIPAVVPYVGGQALERIDGAQSLEFYSSILNQCRHAPAA